MNFEVVDGCPVPAKVAPQIRALKRESGATLVSCYRGDKATSLLRRLGKSTQSMLYSLWLRGRGNPANPPRQSTHELYSDGVAYRGPRGRPLKAQWKVGMDWSDSAAVLRAADRLGYRVRRPYSDPREYHHLNFISRPPRPFEPLKHGDRGRRVRRLRWMLRVIRKDGRPYIRKLPKKHQRGFFGDRLKATVKCYQRDQGLKPDGIVGPKTWRRLKASFRFWEARR